MGQNGECQKESPGCVDRMGTCLCHPDSPPLRLAHAVPGSLDQC